MFHFSILLHPKSTFILLNYRQAYTSYLPSLLLSFSSSLLVRRRYISPLETIRQQHTTTTTNIHRHRRTNILLPFVQYGRSYQLLICLGDCAFAHIKEYSRGNDVHIALVLLLKTVRKDSCAYNASMISNDDN